MALSEEQERVEAIGEQLRAKIASKFTASTFLAGFALTVLAGQVFALWQASQLPLLFPPSVGAVFGALLLFVGAVIKLDELTMPKRFWPEDPKASDSARSRGGYLTDQDLWELRKHMIFFWQRLTISATVITALAVFAMLLPLPPLDVKMARQWTFWWALAGVTAAGVYAIWLIAKTAKTFVPLMRPFD